MSELSHAHPAVLKSLALWHDMVAQQDLSRLQEIIHPQATFHSPAAFRPYAGREALCFILNQVLQVFQDFAYHRQAVDQDGLNVVLEFSAKVGDKGIKGIDFIQFDEQGMIRDFEVMVRPLNAAMALAEAMGRRVGEQLAKQRTTTP